MHMTIYYCLKKKDKTSGIYYWSTVVLDKVGVKHREYKS
jgi:hypothetical protein